jgi:hypothetical protein
MKKMGYLAALALALASFAGPAAARISDGAEAADNVLWRIKAADCAGAVKRLNAGIADGYPEVALLAGTMFDNGVCLKPDWKKAVHFYVKAYDGGQRAALYRLASGFAAPEHGPDMAAALWWASREKSQFRFSNCTVPDAAADDPDKFVAELRTWPQARLAVCNYMIGVSATLNGEIRYPDRPGSYGVGGDFSLRFLPAVPRIDIKTAETREYQLLGVVDGNTLRDRDSRKVKASFENELRQVAERALKRYPQPAGIAPESSADMHFSFTFEQD